MGVITAPPLWMYARQHFTNHRSTFRDHFRGFAQAILSAKLRKSFQNTQLGITFHYNVLCLNLFVQYVRALMASTLAFKTHGAQTRMELL